MDSIKMLVALYVRFSTADWSPAHILLFSVTDSSPHAD